jgi:hypothetical protein
MNEQGPAIQLCKGGADVCKQVFLVCEVFGDLYSAVYELKKSIFVGF